jgi:serine/threonine protein kinase
MPPEEEVCLQLAKGLEHIHEKRLIHRDIKPHNVLIWVDSTVEKVLMKWADFGLSKKVNERGSHSISEVKGTNNWFSPEILTIMRKGYVGKTTSPDNRPRGTVKSDVFSAGLVFGYYLLDGDHPFGPGSEKNIEENIVNNKPVNMTSKFRYLMSQIEIANYISVLHHCRNKRTSHERDHHGHVEGRSQREDFIGRRRNKNQQLDRTPVKNWAMGSTELCSQSMGIEKQSRKENRRMAAYKFPYGVKD